jgi:hypothetical protein
MARFTLVYLMDEKRKPIDNVMPNDRLFLQPLECKLIKEKHV